MNPKNYMQQSSGLKYGGYNPPQQEAQPKKDGGMLGGMMGGMMGMSDEHSKKHIEQLNAKNEALMAALDQASQSEGGNMPATEYPTMPSNTRVSHASFADAPAEKVAAQNVGIQAATQPPALPPQAPPQGMQPNPQQANFARSQNPAFNVGGGMPDMSALDEAYKRQSQGG